MGIVMIKIISFRFYAIFRVSQGIGSFTALMGHKIETWGVPG